MGLVLFLFKTYQQMPSKQFSHSNYYSTSVNPTTIRETTKIRRNTKTEEVSKIKVFQPLALEIVHDFEEFILLLPLI